MPRKVAAPAVTNQEIDVVRALTVVALLTLAACSPKPVAPPAAPAPKPVVSAFGGPIDARGTEPFWAVAIRGTTLTLSRPGAPDLTAVAPGAVIEPSKASWIGKMPDGQDLKITLYASTCSDGMSDKAYTYAAEVNLPGESPLSGCADKPAAAKAG